MKEKETKRGEIIIYKSQKGPEIKVKLEADTIWLTQEQISLLFGTQRPAITKHFQNIFKSGELKEKSVCSKMEHTASDGKVYKTQFYNLDAIISLGYRVNSTRATQFRIWATKTLKNHLVKGYTINEKRLLETDSKLKEVQQAISFLQKKSKYELLVGQEQEILDLLVNYSKTLTVLRKYDENKLKIPHGKNGRYIFKYDEAERIVDKLKSDLLKKGEASDIFGQQYEGKFEGIIKGIYQSFGGKEVYKSIEEKAANLLYFIIKDHPFVDGNKRTASFLFVYFLDRNNYLYKENGEKKINDNALVTLALLVAVSDPKEKEVMIKIITNLISQ